MPIVRFYWIRHSLSCANLAKQYCNSWIRRVQKGYSCPDPLLSNWPFYQTADHEAVAQVEYLKHKLQNLHIELVLTSFLMRTMETAHALFPTQTVIPVPHIGEKGYGNDNRPLKWTEQKLILGVKHASLDLDRQLNPQTQRLESSLSWINPLYIQDEKLPNDLSLEKFQRFFQKYIWKTARRLLVAEGQDVLNVAVVSHSHFMKDVFKSIGYKDWGKPKNNGVYMLAYDPDDAWRLVDARIIDPGMDVPAWQEGFADRCEPSCKTLVTNCDKKTPKKKNRPSPKKLPAEKSTLQEIEEIEEKEKEITESKLPSFSLSDSDSIYLPTLPSLKISSPSSSSFSRLPSSSFSSSRSLFDDSSPLKKPLMMDSYMSSSSSSLAPTPPSLSSNLIRGSRTSSFDDTANEQEVYSYTPPSPSTSTSTSVRGLPSRLATTVQESALTPEPPKLKFTIPSMEESSYLEEVPLSEQPERLFSKHAELFSPPRATSLYSSSGTSLSSMTRPSYSTKDSVDSFSLSSSLASPSTSMRFQDEIPRNKKTSRKSIAASRKLGYPAGFVR